MKIQVLSDVHLEFAPFDPPDADADVVVLAGDIGVGPMAVEWAALTFRQPVVYVTGNHEYYGGHLRNTLVKIKRTAEGTNVRVLDCEGVVLDGVRFLGATLWTDFQSTGNAALAQHQAEQHMTDYRRIRAAAYRRLRPTDTVAEHLRARRFLAESLSQPHPGATVVVTHHAPSLRSIAERFRRSDFHINAAYVTDLEELMPGATLWVHGHTHVAFDYRVADTRVVCNPRGYVPFEQVAGFDPGLVVTV